jgi:hypothetical protein
MVPSVIFRSTPHQPTREASISEGRNLNEFSQQPVIMTAEAGVFYMPQSWDMGQIIWLPLRRKVCWGFLHEKNPTASARFEPANSGTSGQHANHQTTEAVITRSLFTVHSAMVYVIQVCRSRSICSCSKAVYKPVWHIPLLSVDVDCRTGSLHRGPCIRALCAPHVGIVSFRHLQRHSAPTGARDLY